MDWTTAGVSNGIPAAILRSTNFVNVRTTSNPDWVCAGDGVTDDGTNLSRVVNLVGNPSTPGHGLSNVIYMPAGIYKIDAVALMAKFGGNFTIRGDGMNRTIVLFTNSGYWRFNASQFPVPSTDMAITAGATLGSSTVTVADASTVEVGSQIKITLATPTYFHWVQNSPDSTRFISSMYLVLAKTATDVTFTPAIPWDMSSFSPRLIPYSSGSGANPVHSWMSIEDLTLDMTNSTSGQAIYAEAMWDCWMKNVEIRGSNARQIFFYNCNRWTLNGLYVHGVRSSGPNHEGIDFQRDSCWNLVENGIHDNGGFPQIMLGDSAAGCMGNVVFANFLLGCDTGDGGITAGSDISFNHGMGQMLNLCEGNSFGQYKSDRYSGSDGFETLFRNNISITHTTATTASSFKAVSFNAGQNSNNVVGNVLGTASFSGDYQTTNSSYTTKQIYELGFPNQGNNGFTGFFGPTVPPDYSALDNVQQSTDNQKLDLNVSATLLRHGNWVAQTGIVSGLVWTNVSGQTGIEWASGEVRGLDNSWCYSASPSWWGTNRWPAIGPDQSPNTSWIPAESRYYSGTIYPASVSRIAIGNRAIIGRTTGQ